MEIYRLEAFIHASHPPVRLDRWANPLILKTEILSFAKYSYFRSIIKDREKWYFLIIHISILLCFA